MGTSVNNKCKAFTSLEQSRKLAEILPPDSADMRYGYTASYDYSDRMYDGGYDEIPYPKDFLIKNPNYTADEYNAELPCWSLAALLGVLPDESDIVKGKVDVVDDKYMCAVCIKEELITTFGNNPIDACYEMIIRLHELNLL